MISKTAFKILDTEDFKALISLRSGVTQGASTCFEQSNIASIMPSALIYNNSNKQLSLLSHSTNC